MNDARPEDEKTLELVELRMVEPMGCPMRRRVLLGTTPAII